MNKQERDSRVDFSVIIPAYRPEYLGIAIKSVLAQKNVSYEIIIVDDTKTDAIEILTKKFKNKNIRYYKSEKNLGYPLKVIKGFEVAKGTYVFTLGDDDFILYDDTFEKIKTIMDETRVGIGKIGGFSYDTDIHTLVKSFIHFTKVTTRKPSASHNVLLDMLDFNFGFFSGITFRKEFVDTKKLINHMGFVYFPVLFDVIQKKGCVYIPDLYIIARLSFEMLPVYFDIKKHGSFFMRDFIELAYKEIRNKTSFEEFRLKYLTTNLFFITNIRYFTSIENAYHVAWSMVSLDKRLLFNPMFYVYTGLVILPRPIIKEIRKVVLERSANQAKSYLKPDTYHRLIQHLL
ncbi:MAG TPA: glycosyltransferase family 2 protein [Candidatus Saccharimonadales bacterium]|nr:glycosyltransferase family 2 protein [Candidatus Saccharimonadales bacterium]